jgi:subtilisin family serine protease
MSLGKLLILAAGTFAATSTIASAQVDLRGASSNAEVIAGQFICVFSPRYAVPGSSVGAEARLVARDAGGQVGRVFSNSIRGFVVRASEQGVRRMLSQNPNLSYCEPDQVMRIEPMAPPPGKGPNKDTGDGGGDTTSSQSTPWGIARVGGAASGSGKRAWIIDSGVDLDHPDLNVDVGLSRDFTNSRKGADDENGHGTHVAGTVAALDNDIGVVGVAAGASVVAVRVLDRRGSGSYSGVIAGVDYVAKNGSTGDVANMSLGGPFSQALNDAVIAASETVKFTLAAGNSGANANNYSPASANGNNIYTVSAFSQGDNWASFSNYGNPPVDYAEPGVSIESTWKSGSYNTISGTSMAAPHLAGILLLGNESTDGAVKGDPDGNADPIGVR